MSEIWGEKAPTTASGYVTKIAGCRIEKEGLYTRSLNDYITEKTMQFKMTLLESDIVRSEMYGAGMT
jgi:hypothetical protein